MGQVSYDYPLYNTMRASVAQHENAKLLSLEAYRSVFNREPVLTERQYLQAVACLESTYGGGWKGAGVGSNNMGAIQAGKPPCDGITSFQTGDIHADGSGYVWCYKKYPTPLDGWIDLVKVLYQNRETVRRAAANGRLDIAVAEQRATGYFEAPLDRYASGLDSCLRELTAVLGEPFTSPKVPADIDSHGGLPLPPLVLPPTIQYGARGSVVKKWQLIVGVTPDGRFGPLTRQATTIYQVKHGLKADGIVGPKTWRAALS